MHSNLRFSPERGTLFNDWFTIPFPRANRRIKPVKNRTFEVFTEDEIVEAASENDRDLFKRFRKLKERRNAEIIRKKNASWIILKGFILILCIFCFLYQSSKFCILYFSYPTTLSLAVTRPKVIIKPAFTFCSGYGVSRTYFCTEYPNLCMKPINLTQFCEKYDFNCRGDNSKLMIPKFGDKIYLETEELEALHHILHSSVPSQNKGNPWSFNVTNESHMKTNLIYFKRIGLRLMCFSSNLHFNDNAEPDNWKLSSSQRETRKFIDHFILKMQANESILYMELPVVFFSVHSPFIQDNPFIVQNELKLGHRYEVYVRLEEEHLLPHPYPTNCTDYDELWRKNNKTGPRSQEACQEKCSNSFEEQCWKYASAQNVLKNNGTCS
ncbi:uncharacterized protein NPIL_170271 [Nephila pilipes]|uniref:Uncharacterized protein n=1 Tax=Nephila pilipes TaxID=299642 RepID=A0A8X6TWG9_NEPPI|nr:uncharacterized protein NPIL_170271 [Nephila pilipes]